MNRKASLIERPTIQKLLASILLVLFTISFIPKSYFHDVVANHKDVITCEHPGKEATCVHQKGFSCSFNDLVVTTPYVSDIAGIGLVNPDFYLSYTNSYSQLLLQQYSFYAESRGPPSFVA